MARHIRWTSKTTRRLLSAGMTEQEIGDERARFEALCARKPRGKSVKMTGHLQQALFRLGLGPQETQEIADHLTELEEAAKDEDQMAVDKLRENDRERKRRSREENRDHYNAYQREYMRAKRAGAKTRSERASRAANIRWGNTPNPGKCEESSQSD